MKIFGIAVGLAALCAAGSANASIIYDTITGQTTVAGINPRAAGSHGPMGASFVVTNTTLITSLTFVMKDITTNDNGAVLLYLVPNSNPGAPTTPSHSGVTLTGATPLGKIFDSQMPSTFGLVTVATNKVVAPGTYWIEMVDAASTVNGDGTGSVTAAQWAWNTDVLGLGVPTSGNIYNLSNAGNTDLQGFPASGNQIFALQIQAPEPASLALLGAGLVGLGFSRRRRSKKSTT